MRDTRNGFSYINLLKAKVMRYILIEVIIWLSRYNIAKHVCVPYI